MLDIHVHLYVPGNMHECICKISTPHSDPKELEAHVAMGRGPQVTELE